MNIKHWLKQNKWTAVAVVCGIPVALVGAVSTTVAAGVVLDGIAGWFQ